MTLEIAVLTLLHVLILVYWLGGDLGAFYSSTILTDAAQPPAARLAAAKVLANIDMAPRTALILAFPTGLWLAAAKGWFAVSPPVLALIWALGLGWLALAWTIHLRHLAPSAPMRKLDLWIRWAALLALLAFAAAPQIFSVEAPLFLRLKAAILAGAIGLGLAIRVVLAPFGPAFAAMARSGPTAETDATIVKSLNQGRPIVLALWALLLAAAFLGLYAPL